MAIRGLEEKHEHGAQQVARDTRPLGARVAEFLLNPVTAISFNVTGAVGLFLFTAFADAILVALTLLFLFIITSEKTLPFRLPRSSKELDYNDIIPGTAKPKKAGGISFFGNDRNSGHELWFTNDDLRTHVLIFGSTGSGKTEALVSIAFNSLVQSSGFIYVDGKGDNSLFAKIFSIVRAMGREDDILLINFMTGARDVLGPQTNRLSNTMNPFSHGSSSMLSQLVVSLMDSGSGDQSGDMWKGRAINFVESLMKILTVMRDAGHILLDANTIRDYFILEKLESIVVDKLFPLGENNFKVPINDLPQVVLDPLKNYVLNLPGYNPKNKYNQSGEVREQHGFITMQLTRVFGSLADTYGHIIRTNLAEVDLKDVVLNRRVLVVLLPALEKSPEELANLGKVIIASLKAMMAAGLGDKVEGDYRDVILSKPTTSPSPYVCIMDEYGYYAVKGFAVVPAQARSLGFSAIFAGQDLPAFQKASKEEAASIGANCNIKICMKLEDPMETWDFFNKTAGETYVTNVSGFQMDSGSVSLNYLDTKNASVDRRQRIELLDLKDQREGEAHIFFKSKIIRAEMFYANPKPVKTLKINHLLKVEIPNTKELIELEKRIERFKNIFVKNAFDEPKLVDNSDIAVLKHSIEEAFTMKPLERAISGLISILEYEITKQKALNAESEQEEQANTNKDPTQEIAANKDFTETKISIFAGIKVSELIKTIVDDADQEIFKLPLLRRGHLTEELAHIERLSGNDQAIATSNSEQLINQLLELTSFPIGDIKSMTIDNYMVDLKQIIKLLGGSISEEELIEEIQEESEAIPDLPLFPGLPELPNLDDLAEGDNEDD
jgi:intracellular multiplication protein IcmO